MIVKAKVKVKFVYMSGVYGKAFTKFFWIWNFQFKIWLSFMLIVYVT